MTGIRLAAQTDIPELVRLRVLLFADLETTWGPLPSDSTWRLDASPVGDRLYRSLGFTDHPDAALRRTRPA